MTEIAAPALLEETRADSFERAFFLRACLFLTVVPILFFPAYYLLTGAGRPQTLSQILSFLLILSTMYDRTSPLRGSRHR